MARAIATDCRWPARHGLNRILDVGEIGVEPVDDLAGLGLHGVVVQGAEVGHQFPAKEQVGRRVEIVGQGQRLIDGLDAVAAGVARAVDHRLFHR